MKKFSEFRVGDAFYSTCSISEGELGDYLNFSRIRNAFLEEMQKKRGSGGRGGGNGTMVSGRAVLARMEGEFTRLSQIYGNHIVFLGTDGDAEWGNRSVRFPNPLYTDQVLKLKFTVSGKEDEADEEYGRLAIDYEGTDQEGRTVVVSKRNLYRIRKEPPPRR